MAEPPHPYIDLAANDQYVNLPPKEKNFRGSLGSPGLKILNQKEIADRLSSKQLYKRSKTLNLYDSEDEEVMIREIGSGKNSGERKGSEPIYDFGSRGSGGSGDSVHLEDFKILKFISKGSFGNVFLAYLPKSDTYFAIKCL